MIKEQYKLSRMHEIFMCERIQAYLFIEKKYINKCIVK